VAEAAQLDRFYREDANKGEVLVVGVDDTAANMGALVKSAGYQFPVMMDASGQVAAKYGVRAVPTVLVINGSGLIWKTRVGGLTTSELVSLVDDASR
jgi:hypothetical protein